MSALLTEPTRWVLFLGSFLFCQRTGREAPIWCLLSEWLTRTLFAKGAPQCRVGRGRVDSFSTSWGSGLGETVSEDGLGSVEKSVMEGEVLSVPWEISRTEGDRACL